MTLSLQEAVCYVFGINNAADFKVSLTKQEMMLRMDRGQKILRGVPVEGYAEEPIGAHFTRPPPKTVLSKPKPKKRAVAAAPEAAYEYESQDSSTGMEALPGTVPASKPKKKLRRIIKRTALIQVTCCAVMCCNVIKILCSS